MNELFNVQNLTQFEFGAIILTVLIAGLVFGCLIAWGLLNRKTSPKAMAAEKIKEEFEEYKEKVDEHFTQTSEMFKDVTTQYKKLYDHMAVGAVSLGNADTIAMPRLEMQEDSEDDPEMAAEEPETDQTENVAEQETDTSVMEEQEPSSEDGETENNEQTVEEQIAEAVEESSDELTEKQSQQENKTS